MLGTPRVGNTQLDDLAACRADFTKYGVSSHRFVTGASCSVPDAAHDEEKVLGFVVGHGIEGVGAAHVVAECRPAVEGAFLALLCSNGDGMAGCLRPRPRSREKRFEMAGGAGPKALVADMPVQSERAVQCRCCRRDPSSDMTLTSPGRKMP